jgi:hypothetical protein
MSRKLLSIALATFLSLAATSAVEAGAPGGPKFDDFTLPAQTSVTYNVHFYGGELAALTLVGDGYTDLDVYVYDEYGNLVASGTDWIDGAVVTWYPRWTGPFTVKVVNRGYTYNDFRIGVN